MRPTKTRLPRLLLVIGLLMVLAIPSVPPAAGDGIPTFSYGEVQTEPEKTFSSITESRQLAKVELLNGTHEKISLFLSVYSLDPGKNLTILVPLRTLPLDVTGEPLKESAFRENYGLKDAEDQVVSQDPDQAWPDFGRSIRDDLRFAFGCMLWTMPGEYTREKIVRQSSHGDSKNEDLGGGSGGSFGEPEPVKHYEFDGFSIDVYNLSAGPRLTEYLVQKGLVMPNSTVLQGYNDHFVAVIESKTKPPMEERKFMDLKENHTNAYLWILDQSKHDTHLSDYEYEDLIWEMEDRIESYNSGDSGIPHNMLARDAVNAFFGDVDYAGEVINVVLPLDSGKMFFPLGTSAGWPNAVGDIDILFEVPSDKAVSLPSSKDAFVGDKHCYLVQMQDAKPDFDLESSVGPTDDNDELGHKVAGFVTDHSTLLSGFVTALIIIVFWVGLALMVGNAYKKKAVLKDPALWLVLAGSLLLSLPGAFLVYMLFRPIAPEKLMKEVVPLCACTTFVIAIAFNIVMVMV